MTTWDMWALAIGLAMDCFTISMTGGILMKRIRWPLVLRSAFLFGFFQTLMPAAGWFLGQRLNSRIEKFDHWIAFALLFFLGVKMIYDSVRPKKKDGQESGMDFSSLRVTLLLALVTSLDSLAVGVSLGFVHTLTRESIVEAIGIIGLVSFLLSVAGFMAGLFFSKLQMLRPGLLGGLVLIGISLKMLTEHLS